MCGRFSLVATDRALSTRFHVADWPRARLPRHNIVPTQMVLCLRWENGEIRPVYSRWGLVPRFAADASGAARMINARGGNPAGKALVPQSGGEKPVPDFG